MRTRSIRRGRKVAVAAISVVAALALMIACLWLWPLSHPTSRSNDVSSAEADAAFSAMMAADAADETLLPECRTSRYEPSEPSRGTVLVLHGYTSCPHQFVVVAEALQADGYTVLVPRLPGHGYADRILEMGAVDAGGLAAFGDRMVDIAAASSSELTVLGLSGGGTLALWLREHRPEIDKTVALAPLLNPAAVPTFARRGVANLLSILPTIPIWWDFDLKEKAQVPRYSYAQWQTHSIAALMALGDAVGADSEARPSPAWIVSNGADESVDNAEIATLIATLDARGDGVTGVEIPASYALPHEYVDPGDPNQKLSSVLPGLLRLVEDGDPSELPR